jgi:hypothetical protein
VTGPVAKLEFDVTGGAVTKADFVFFPANITLGSDLDALIAPWVLGTDKAYYAK